jgi:hypothetical protein
MRLGALLEAITRKEGIDALKIKATQKLGSDKVKVEKMGANKLIVSMLFKSQSEKASESQKLLQSIAQTEKDIVNFDIIRNYLTVYLAEIAIPSFKN